MIHWPRFFRAVERIGSKTGFGADPPIRHAVVASRHGQVGMAAAILDANEQNRLIARLARAGVKHRMCRVGPIAGSENRVALVAVEKIRVHTNGRRFSKQVDFHR
jgi:hypothetical protein